MFMSFMSAGRTDTVLVMTEDTVGTMVSHSRAYIKERYRELVEVIQWLADKSVSLS